MRRQLAIAAAAVSSMIVLAFVVPLGLLVRTLAEDRAIANAERRAQLLVPAIASFDQPQQLEAFIERLPNPDDLGVTVVLADGTTVGAPAPLGPDLELARTGKAFNTDVDGGTAVLLPVTTSAGTQVVRVFVPGAQMRNGVYPAWIVLAGLGLSLVIVATAVADRMAKSIVAPVDELATTAERLGHGDLDARFDASGPPEIVEVGETLNRLAARIAELLTAERESVADLSHRLRTPVTALRLDVDALPDSDAKDRLVGDVDALARSVDRLIAEARRPTTPEGEAATDVAALARERVAFWSALADEQGRAYVADIDPGPITVGVTTDDLVALFDAALTNIFAHTPEGVGFTVTVTATDAATDDGPAGPADRRSNPSVVIAFTDDGPGWPDLGVIGRGESRGGSTGLGLDIIRRTAEAAGGHVELGRAANRTGARLVITLPAT